MNSKPDSVLDLSSRMAGIVVFLLAAAVYANTLTNELVFDDLLFLENQPAVRNAADVRAIWLGRFWGEIWPHNVIYRPLTVWSMAVNHALNRSIGLDGIHVVSYHLVNLLLHAGVSVACLHLFKRMGVPKRGALAGALLFAVHPIHTEAVAAITGRGELLAALFGLCGLILHRDSRSPILTTTCFLAALCSKESAIAFPAVAVCWDVLADDRFSRERWLRYAGYAAAVTGWLAIRSHVIAGIETPPMTLPLSEYPAPVRVLTAMHVQFRYLLLQVLPVGLSSDYSHNQIPTVRSIVDFHVLGYAASVASATWAAWKWRVCTAVPLAVVAYGLLFFPASNLLIPIGTVMGERLAYAPSVFFCAIFGLLFHRAFRAAPLMVAGVAIVLAAFAWLTAARNATWADAGTFHATQLASAPNSASANYGAGRALHEAGDTTAAVQLYRRALEIRPAYPDAWNNLGVAVRDLGDSESALGMFDRALALEPAHARAHYNRGQTLESLGRGAEAEEAYRAAIEIEPAYPEALNNLAVILAGHGRLVEAARYWERALEADPGYQIARTNLDRLNRMIGR